MLGGSAALDVGQSSGASTDARGVTRPFDIAAISNAALGGNGADIGAVEMQARLVTQINDAGSGSLREALTAANNNGTGLDDVIFHGSVFDTPQTIQLATALPDINSALTLSGAGADRLTIRRSAAAAFRIFRFNPGQTIAAIAGVKIENGSTPDFGGGVYSQSPLTLASVHLRGNSANIGGAVSLRDAGGTFRDSTFNANSSSGSNGRPAGIHLRNSGPLPLRIINCTISGNAASGTDGGIFNFADANGVSLMEVSNSTITLNTSTITGGIASVSIGGLQADVVVRNSIVANNTINNLGVFASTGTATIRSLGHNLSDTLASNTFFDQIFDLTGVDPMLVPLAMNGGSMPTHALAVGSRAIDEGTSIGGDTLHDQRGPGFLRTFDDPAVSNANDGTDIGAFENQIVRLFFDGFEN